MPKNLIEQLEQEYLAQQIRDIVGNRLTLALTILNHLRDGKRVNRRLINRAILDLKGIVRNARTSTKQPGPLTTRKPARPVTPESSRP